ncbi:hypothetical protein [Lentilactobacillus kisonensis]|uniref:Uncharacterized protein n=2 Tax=Lentilactobacillus kisonensis TaxID=481722 RepID=A0A0R1NXJ8_9LACO|nr:hypothetical protein [Lentilactobacillus kisonensis]KRL22482.1 hypothetical protein FC98_GL002368 [Lentilactobacillus kisonensis DSM 19906 = JCM 15041]
MTINDTTSWKDSLQSEASFKNFITKYFQEHKELTGKYEVPSYYEYYTAHLDSRDGIIIALTTGVNQSVNSPIAPLPFKQKEKMSIEQFRQLILNKKFADMQVSLADVFKAVAGVPTAKSTNQ